MWVKALQFAVTPFGKALMILLALTLWTAYQRQDAAREEGARVTLAYESAKVIEAARQKAAGDAALRAAEARAVGAEAKVAEFQEIANGLDVENKSAGKSCGLDDSTRKRLLSIK